MNDTSTKRAEEIAYNLQLSGVSGSTWNATEVEASNMLRALAAERDDLAKRLKDAERERNHQHGRADRNAAQYAAEQAKREQLQAENKKLRTALRSIAANTCCDRCQEAALVARAALGEKE
jgi:hypothetical protein